MHTSLTPKWDQPFAIERIVHYVKKQHRFQTLWGVTGSGKTFTMAKIIEALQKPTLIIAHNKTLAAQLAGEFKSFFPNNAVHYFVSYYDYYQPEAYIKKTDTYIEKEALINEEINQLRHATTQDLLTRKDVIIVASVSCIYGIGDIQSYREACIRIEVWKKYKRETFLEDCLYLQYERTFDQIFPWSFQVKWENIEIYPIGNEYSYYIEFFDDEVVSIFVKDIITKKFISNVPSIDIFPAKHTIIPKKTVKRILPKIEAELKDRLRFFEKHGMLIPYERLKARVEYDMEMLEETGYVKGIENYSRYLDERNPWEPPTTLVDYFWNDFLCFIDESHMTLPQIRAMYRGDYSRKKNLVDEWFRLPSAFDNRPLKFHEFEQKIPFMVFVSATPGEYEIKKSSKYPEKFFSFNVFTWKKWEDDENNRIVAQMIRPTGLLDPKIELRSMEHMVDGIMTHISYIKKYNQKMIILTLTKRSSEELCDFLWEHGIAVMYLHSEIDTLERLDILNNIRNGYIDVIVGINLLREGIDLPEVSTIVILNADKQWFLRNTRSLIQMIGRAARNEHGTVYMYCDQLKHVIQKTESLLEYKNQAFPFWDYLLSYDGTKIPLYTFDKGRFLTKEGLFVSESMKEAINLTHYRRNLQKQYNEMHSIIPTTVKSSMMHIPFWKKRKKSYAYSYDENNLEQEKIRIEKEMERAIIHMEYDKAASLRDILKEITEKLTHT